MAVGDASDIAFQTQHQIRLVKAALLYADKVTLCNPIVHMLMAMERVQRFSPRQQAQLLRLLVPTLENADKAPATEMFLLFLDALISGKQLPAKLRAFQREMEAQLDQTFVELRETSRQQAQEYRLDQLARLIQTGRVKVQTMGEPISDVEVIAGSVQSAAHLEQILRRGKTQGDELRYNDKFFQDDLFKDFIKRLESAVNSNKTYPLFDDFTGNLVRIGLKEGHIATTDVQTGRAKHLGLAASLIERLPMFEEASVDELLDIREELQRPLVNFRRAVMEFSATVASAPWENDFAAEADNVFRGKVEPALLEIEDAMQSNTYLAEVGRRLVKEPFMVAGTGSALSVALSQTQALGGVAASALGVGASTAVLLGDAWREYVEEKNKIETNQLFFYYRAGEQLQKNQ